MRTLIIKASDTITVPLAFFDWLYLVSPTFIIEPIFASLWDSDAHHQSWVRWQGASSRWRLHPPSLIVRPKMAISLSWSTISKNFVRSISLSSYVHHSSSLKPWWLPVVRICSGRSHSYGHETAPRISESVPVPPPVVRSGLWPWVPQGFWHHHLAWVSPLA